MRLYHALTRRAFVTPLSRLLYSSQRALNGSNWYRSNDAGTNEAEADGGYVSAHWPQGVPKSDIDSNHHSVATSSLSKEPTRTQPPSLVRDGERQSASEDPLCLQPSGESKVDYADVPYRPVLDNPFSSRLRKVMRLTPSSVVIVFAGHYQGIDPDDEVYGMLVASFVPVSLEPEPYVSFNIKSPSRTYDQMLQSKTFTVLAPTNAMLAAAFAKPGKKNAILRQVLDQDGDILSKQPGVLWLAHCELLPNKSIDVGDHVLVVGKVVDVRMQPHRKHPKHVVVYAYGQYCELGSTIHPHDAAFDLGGDLHEQGMRDEKGGPYTEDTRKAHTVPEARAKMVKALLEEPSRRIKADKKQKKLLDKFEQWSSIQDTRMGMRRLAVGRDNLSLLRELKQRLKKWSRDKKQAHKKTFIRRTTTNFEEDSESRFESSGEEEGILAIIDQFFSQDFINKLNIGSDHNRRESDDRASEAATTAFRRPGKRLPSTGRRRHSRVHVPRDRVDNLIPSHLREQHPGQEDFPFLEQEQAAEIAMDAVPTARDSDQVAVKESDDNKSASDSGNTVIDRRPAKMTASMRGLYDSFSKWTQVSNSQATKTSEHKEEAVAEENKRSPSRTVSSTARKGEAAVFDPEAVLEAKDAAPEKSDA